MALELNGTTGVSLVQDGVVVAADLNSALSDTIGKVKAWVNFNATGVIAIRASYNVASITDNGVGGYTINFTTAISDSNYAVTQCGPDTTFGGSPFVRALHVVYSTRTTTSVQVTLQYAGATSAGYLDYDENHIAIFR